MRKILTSIVLIASLGFFSVSSGNVDFFEISKNVEIFIAMFREINMSYVENIEATKSMRKAIDAMLTDLDPYTEFYSESEREDFLIQTTGKYGGIGAIISKRDDYVIILEPYEGMPADIAGLKSGDRIIEIDGKSMKDKTTDQVTKLLKGTAGTTFQISIDRLQKDNSYKRMNFKITRKEVVLKNVPYYGMASDGIGYIKLTNFMENASKDVKNALVELKAKNEVKSLILDLRGNPGGLLNEAVDICNLFLPRGQIVVSTKGKIKEMQKEHITSNNPEDLNIPIVVLVNGSSASASEIVSGALQDYDRAVVLGGRTFGKGLVQTTKSLPFNTTLKLTTAKYYIPSGRCIQAINYAEKNPDGSVKKVPDSLKKEFFTVNKRKVYDGGGIEPDIKTKPEYIKSLELELIGKGIIDDYAIRYVINNPKPLNAKSYQFKENEYANFVSFAKAHSDFKYQTPVEKQIEALKKTAEEENSSEVKEDIEMLESKLKSIRLKEFEKLKTSIMELIQFKIVEKYFYQSGVIENSFQFDKDIQEATKLLNNSAEYKKILK